MNPATREFVVWDGEGITKDDGSHNYVLFGSYNGTEHLYRKSTRLTTLTCIRQMFESKRKNPYAYNVAFAFDYDVNMILQDMSEKQFEVLRRNQGVRFYDYFITHVPHKWFSVSDMRLSKNDLYRTVRIEDTWGFFQGSFLKALEQYIPDHEHYADIKAGKARRSQFTLEEMDSILHYWKVEAEAMHALINALRDNLYSVNLNITKWHGPGALANYTYKKRGIEAHKTDCGKEVYDAARYAYAGGRFELFRLGNHGRAWGIDINSAYPYAISLLPSLTEGRWIHRTGRVEKLEPFGMYRIRIRMRHHDPFVKIPGPLFHRDERGNISYPHTLEGWYWTPELQPMLALGYGFTILEAWEYVDWQTKPFAFVADMYEQRRQFKADGIGAEKALKLCLNSLYGKMAQRVGWEHKMAAPKWHQLEWAGWVTSLTRAMLFRKICAAGWKNLVAVETDGIYITKDPAELGITDSKLLGEFSITEYDELVYLQSGVYAMRQGDKWKTKYRGLDATSVTPEQIVRHAELLRPNKPWPDLVGTTTRFIGYPAALKSADFSAVHSRWETKPHEIAIAKRGKRVHSQMHCDACKLGATAAEMPHDLIIHPPTELMSHRHDIPWLDGPSDTNEWRDHAESLEGFWNA